MREIHSLAEFDALLASGGGLDGVVVQGVDLSNRTDALLGATCAGATFLGANLDDAALRHVHDEGAVVFPRLPHLPFDPYRPHLYDQAELLDGWQPGGDFGLALDSLIHRWADQHPRGTHLPVIDALARRLHDHAIDDALRDHLDHHPDVVAVMGGHGLTRDDPIYRTITELGRSLARAGLHVATGGGPGAMEAANLGAWLAPHPDAAIAAAIETLAEAPRFEQTDPYLTAGAQVVAAHPGGGSSLAVPTWFYGHEPTNQFATHIAKYFANSIREDGLLAIAQRGVVFAPGSAGTVQEIFQDATQNHYEVFDTVSPMILFGAEYWTHTLPALPLLRKLAGQRRYAPLVAVAETADEVVSLLLDVDR
jgi:predicted Rossmann-fold nucleotide-binding protein